MLGIAGGPALLEAGLRVMLRGLKGPGQPLGGRRVLMGHRTCGEAVGSHKGAKWQLAGSPLGTMEAETGLHTGVWVCPGVWIPNRGYTQVFEYAQASGSQLGLFTDVWIPNRGYT